MSRILLSAGGSSLTNILEMGTELWTWLISQMTSVITFISANPLILVFFVMSICGFVVGILMRIWHSAG